MSNNLRKLIYKNLKLIETDELVEIWKINNRAEWSELAFDVIREILQQRLGEIPPQGEPVYEHIKQDADMEKPVSKEWLELQNENVRERRAASYKLSKSELKPLISFNSKWDTALIGVFTTLISMFALAFFFDSLAMLKNPGFFVQQGYFFLAAICSYPIALLIGPISGILGGRIGGKYGRRLYDRISWNNLVYRRIGAGIAGLVAGVLPYALLWYLLGFGLFDHL